MVERTPGKLFPFVNSGAWISLRTMARKDSANAKKSRGFDDVVAISLIGVSALLLIALFTYHRNDVSANTTAVNHPRHDLIGPVGAWTAFGLFWTLGAAAYIMPVLMLIFATGYLFDFLAYLKRRWLAALALLMASMGLLDTYRDTVLLASFHDALNALPGGLFGQGIGYLFGFFGPVGATIIFATVYIISFYFLTDLRLGDWLRQVLSRGAVDGEGSSVKEQALERRARELEKEARRLQEQVERSGLGADLQPVPEPTVRDLSVPQSRGQKPPGKAPRPAEPRAVEVTPEVEVISAREIAAATTPELLGRSASAKSANPEAPAEVATKDLEAPTPAPTDSTAPAKIRPAPRKPKPITVAATPKIGNYQLPPFDFLQFPDHTVKPTESKEELMANARLMQQTLAQFDIEVSLGDITKGPTITRYELHPAPGVKLEKITALNNNIAAALKAERINILAPVPGKSSVGVEVPNLVKTKVIMRDLLESEEWQKTKARIPLALGKDVYGQPIVTDLAEMPHLLIAGSTGSGKSVCINGIVASLLYRFPPDQLRFVMIDPKVVELQQYNGLPHLVVPVVNDPKKVILALRWVVNEMEKRYQIFARVGVRNIQSFNSRPKDKPLPKPQPELPLKAKKEKVEAAADGFAVELDEEIVVPRDDDIVIPEKLSYIVVIIDELADLMLVAPADVEMAIARITQMARAAGIHCIVATQRPSVDVITGVIKANIPARIAFQVAAKVDSRTILDAMGADKLLGKGDMLYLPPGSAKLIRAQGVLITDQEIQAIVDFIKKQGQPSYEIEIHEQLSKPAGSLESDNTCDEDEDLIQQCIEVIRSEQKASVSLLQRRLRLGYTRAARIMDELENRGIVGPGKGAEPRDILIDLDGTGADGNKTP
jgi:S-DNA-T family DNA segregation ATPase FtsK/SpoIIIE